MDVIQHFRNSMGATNISKDVSIDVFAQEFSNRERYLESVKAKILSRSAHPGIVFLDPDTGLEPESGRFGPTHVSSAELREIWTALGKGDFLVFYQHQDNRAGNEWKDRKRIQLAGTLGFFGADSARVKLAHAPLIAHDVASFFAEKI